MRKIILQEFVSLDALAAGPKDSVDFVPASMQGDQKFGQNQLELMDSIDAILLGRVTYEMFATYWPDVTTGEDKQFAEKINRIPKLVFSNTLDRAPWGKWDDAKIVKGDASAEVTKLKESPGKDMIIWGSISLAQSLLADGLVDEVQLVICPLVLGSGKPLFEGNTDSTEMELLRSESFERGAVLLAYATR